MQLAPSNKLREPLIENHCFRYLTVLVVNIFVGWTLALLTCTSGTAVCLWSGWRCPDVGLNLRKRTERRSKTCAGTSTSCQRSSFRWMHPASWPPKTKHPKQIQLMVNIVVSFVVFILCWHGLVFTSYNCT